jgi:N-acetylmuramoyl-L-alanine amidase
VHVLALLLIVGAALFIAVSRFVSAGAEKPVQVAPAAASQVSVDVPRDWVQGGLTPGTCVALKPARKASRTIFIDPGHGGLDPGAVGETSAGKTVAEKTLSLAVALNLARRLVADGYNVVLARTTDVNVARMSDQDQDSGALTAAAVRRDTLARVACANAAKADALVSIHFDAFDDPSVGGIETVYDDARPFAADNFHLAKAVHSSILGRFQAGGWPVPDRGVWTDSDAGVTALTNEGASYGHLVELGPRQPGWVDRPSAMPGILVEPLFVTRPSEADLAASSQGQDAIARGIEAGLRAYFG